MRIPVKTATPGANVSAPPAPLTITGPSQEQENDSLEFASGFIVIVYDNDSNTVLEVINILIMATQCSFDEAEIEAWEVDHLGKSVVHHGGKEECERAAGIIRQIGIRVEVIEE